MEQIEKKIEAVMGKVNRRVVKQIETETKRVYEHYIADYYYYTPRRYERQDNLWYGLKIVKHKSGDIYDDIKIRVSGVYFPRRYESGINPDIVMNMVLEGSRRPYWFSAVDSNNFGRHVVKYSGDNYGNQIFETKKGLTFDDMMNKAIKQSSSNLRKYMITYFKKYWRGISV